jgi:SAM-dependent MidA family methyltransferase
MNNIHEIIQKEVLEAGIISFARFMDLALYCPKSGYYERPDVSPGKKGDFFTSVSVGPLFGELLAFQFSEWLQLLNPTKRQIVETGAHNGQLAHDFLQGMKEQAPGVLESLEYWIVEPSTERKEWQAKTLGDLARYVRWYESWEDTPKSGVTGVIFSNELLDAMPVHRMGWDTREKKWFEWGVTLNEGRFAWSRMPESSLVNSEELLRLPQELMAVLPDQFTTELCPAALDWWRLAAGKLRAGKLLAMDYGLTADQFFTPTRRNGTLRAYFRHHLVEDLLANVGEQDLTAHVNFTQVQKVGELEGLQTEAFQSQAQFLTGIAARIFKQQKDSATWNSAKVRQFQTLTHPEHLGQSFRVLLQSRRPT